MFLLRLFSSLVLIPLVLAALFFAPPTALLGLLAFIYLACGWEWTGLIPLKKPLLILAFFTGLLAVLYLPWQYFQIWQPLCLMLWLFNCLAILGFPVSQQLWGKKPLVWLAAYLLLPFFVFSFIGLYQMHSGQMLILYLLCLIWAADVGAYLAGKQWGRHKMIPQVSPGKSWEGTLGGFSLAMLVAWGGYAYFKPAFAAAWFAWAILTVVISIAGDLFISILKRRCQLKDTGALIPGHGGILDRLDSLIAALPFFYWGLTFYPPGL